MIRWTCPEPISDPLARVLQIALRELDVFHLSTENMVDVTDKIIEQGILLLDGQRVSGNDFVHVLSDVFNARGFTWYWTR